MQDANNGKVKAIAEHLLGAPLDAIDPHAELAEQGDAGLVHAIGLRPDFAIGRIYTEADIREAFMAGRVYNNSFIKIKELEKSAADYVARVRLNKLIATSALQLSD